MINLNEKPFYLTRAQIDWVSSTLSQLSTREKAGQLFCLMGGDYNAAELQKLVTDYCIGGILYRPEPGETIRQHFAPLDSAAKIPLLKAANLEEGGSGGRSDGTFFGWPMAAAATNDLEVVDKFAKVCAKEGQSIGINWTFSPVCDIDMNYRNPIINVRSFGSDKDKVKAMCSQYVRTLQSCGMAACAKHYPGDGVDFRDQHLHPTYNSLSAKDWYDSYGMIYRQLIDDGLMSIMAGHIVQPNVSMDINPELTFADCLPGSLSKELLTGVLREKFGFNGLITTDATIMSGFTQAMPRKDAIPAAINAGCDMFVFTTDFKEDYHYILDALENGTLSVQRLDEAVTRILALKAKVAFQAPSGVMPPQAKEWQKECADKCVTLVKNNQDCLPVTPDKYPLIRLFTLGNDETPDGSMTKIAETYLQQAGFQTERFDIEKEELHGTSGLSDRRLSLYLVNCEHASNLTAVRLFWAKKHALDVPRHPNEEPSIMISFANPYHLQDVPRIKTYINAYSAHGAMIEAALDKLMGRSEFKGVSPVDPFCGLMDTHL